MTPFELGLTIAMYLVISFIFIRLGLIKEELKNISEQLKMKTENEEEDDAEESDY